MKILHLIPTMNPIYGGPIEGLNRIVDSYITLGIESEIAVLDAPDNSPWLDAVRVPTHALGPAMLSYCYSQNLVPWLQANAGRFDAVIVNGLWQYPGCAAWKVLAGTKTPYYVFSHGMLDPWFKRAYPLKHLKKMLYWFWREYLVLRDAKAVLFTCEEERILARQSFWPYKCNEMVVGYGTSRSSGDAVKQRKAFLSEFPELAEKRLFLFLSRIHEKKGCDLLLEAFARVAGKDRALHLVVAGPNQTGWQKELVVLSQRLGIEDRITWTGMITGDMKWGAYHSAEAFVLPSHQENFGIVVAEALSCSLPVLISDKVNIWREVQEDNAGIIAEDTLDGTIELFERWLDMDTRSHVEMRKKALACFESRFEMSRAAQNLIDLVRSDTQGKS
ncbi:MAG: glycosyltransferase [Geobacteraceae bacterium]|nr:glycosyltransferase [Geobacteraceae bacterium]